MRALVHGQSLGVLKLRMDTVSGSLLDRGGNSACLTGSCEEQSKARTGQLSPTPGTEGSERSTKQCSGSSRATYLGGGHGHQVHPGMGFAQHMVTARGIGDDLYTIQAHVNMWAVAEGRHWMDSNGPPQES